jgi:hypothetical protein
LSLKTYLKNFIKLDVSRATNFPEFPNTSPSGKWVDSDDPIPQTFLKLVKNVTLGTSEGTRVTQKPYNGLIEAGFADLPPLPSPL